MNLHCDKYVLYMKSLVLIYADTKGYLLTKQLEYLFIFSREEPRLLYVSCHQNSTNHSFIDLNGDYQNILMTVLFT